MSNRNYITLTEKEAVLAWLYKPEMFLIKRPAYQFKHAKKGHSFLLKEPFVYIKAEVDYIDDWRIVYAKEQFIYANEPAYRLLKKEFGHPAYLMDNDEYPCRMSVIVDNNYINSKGKRVLKFITFRTVGNRRCSR